MSRTDRAIAAIEDGARVLGLLALWVAVILTPVGPAYSVYHAARLRLKYPGIVAVIIGISVEAAGIATSHLAVRSWSWNREHPDQASRVRAWLAVFLVVFYLAIGITLSVLVGVYPSLVVWAPTVVFVLAGVVYVAWALVSDQRRREATVGVAQADAEATEVARRAWLAALRERELRSTSAAARRALAEAGGDHLAALDLLLPGPGLATGLEPKPARIGDFDEMISIVSEQSGGAVFGPADVRRWLGVGRTRAYELVRYGQGVGDVRRVGRGEYVCVNHREGGEHGN